MSEDSASSNLLGSFIRTQRQMANLSLRELSAMTEVSNPYLSQVERGLSEPSARVLKSIAQALNLSAEALFAQAALCPSRPNATKMQRKPHCAWTPESPSHRSGRCSPCTEAISKRTVMGQRTMRRISDCVG
jgi:transcriptional regulator with XRE-family HTH domain